MRKYLKPHISSDIKSTQIGQREKYLVMIGGAPVSQKWADDIGADIYGENAERAVSLALEFMSKKQKS
jgi:methanogenic corrinoid protein MtbC1